MPISSATNYVIIAMFISFQLSLYVYGSTDVSSIKNEKLLTLSKKLEALSYEPVRLDFNEFWRTQSAASKLPRRQNFKDINVLISTLNSQRNTLNFCENIQLTELSHFAALVQERQQLQKSLINSTFQYNGAISQLPNGKSWYQHWLNAWLQENVDIYSLKNTAYQELEQVKLRRNELRLQNLPSNKRHFNANDEQGIVNAFRKREREVSTHLSRVFGTNFLTSQVSIQQSNLPKTFPAPGIYNGAEQTFFYHLQTQHFPEKHMDWLFLHEALPGHHFQSQFIQNKAICADNPNIASSTVFSEGWGAYVETLGENLGLFKDYESIDYALNWQSLRAVRVLLDIGIHFYGWSDAQAEELWLEHIPNQQDIMKREINRIRNWPVQVITYVYGKAMIEQTINKALKEQPTLRLANVHHSILRLSNMSLKSLTYWSKQNYREISD